MLIKQPKSKFTGTKRGLKFFILAEGAIFLTSYLFYAACNRSQTTRKYFYDRPYLRFIVYFYYKIGELNGSRIVQDYDQVTWSAQAKLQAGQSSDSTSIMGAESERCVDELFKKMVLVDELTARIENLHTGGSSDSLFVEGRSLMTETQIYLDNNKSVVPAYSLKKITDSLKRLEEKLNDLQKMKLKFKFNLAPTAQPPKTITKPKVVEALSQTNQTTNKDNHPSQSFFGFRDVTNQQLTLINDEVNSKDVSLLNLENCHVRIMGLANTVYIRNLKDSKVEVCLASRSISIIKCVGCHFKLVCQQLRIDSTYSCNFVVYTSARSMLESSKELKFKCLNPSSLASEECSEDEVKELFKKANFNESQNKWSCIDDFDWLSPSSPSENFTVN